MGLGSDDGLGHLRMAMQGVAGHRAALQDQAVQKVQRRLDLVAAGRPGLGDGEPGLGIPDADHERGHKGAAFLVAAAQALAIHGDDAAGRAQAQFGAQRRHEGIERLGQGLRIEKPEDPAEGIVARRPVGQIDDLAQLFGPTGREVGNIDTALGPAQGGRQRHKQNHAKLVPSIEIARIVHLSQNRQKRCHWTPSAKRKVLQNLFSNPRQYSNAIPLPIKGAGED